MLELAVVLNGYNFTDIHEIFMSFIRFELVCVDVAQYKDEYKTLHQDGMCGILFMK